MAGYIGSKASVTQVDGYNRTEADAEFVQVTGDTMTGALAVNGNLTVDTDTLFVDAANNQVGIGTTSVDGVLSVDGSMYAGPGSVSGVAYGFYPSSTYGNTGMFSPAANTVAFATTGGERARIDASGNFLVGTTIGYGQVTSQSDATKFQYASHNTDTTGASQLSFRFMRNTADVGSITTTSSATAYNTSSDYRLKEDVQPMVGASDRLMALKPVNFAWKVDGTRVDGFLAHEAQEVVPESVTGEKDAVDDEGNPQYQGIDQSKIVPLLTAALQEALTKIEQLEARMATLEGGAA